MPSPNVGLAWTSRAASGQCMHCLGGPRLYKSGAPFMHACTTGNKPRRGSGKVIFAFCCLTRPFDCPTLPHPNIRHCARGSRVYATSASSTSSYLLHQFSAPPCPTIIRHNKCSRHSTVPSSNRQVCRTYFFSKQGLDIKVQGLDIFPYRYISRSPLPKHSLKRQLVFGFLPQIPAAQTYSMLCTASWSNTPIM